MKYTREEVSHHRYGHDCWMIIHGKVYDVTSVLATHPGGAECLLDCAGVDATAAFDDVGHSSYAWDALDECLVGELAPDTRPRPGQQDVPRQAHKQRQRQRQRRAGQADENASPRTAIPALGYALLAALSLAAYLALARYNAF